MIFSDFDTLKSLPIKEKVKALAKLDYALDHVYYERCFDLSDEQTDLFCAMQNALTLARCNVRSFLPGKTDDAAQCIHYQSDNMLYKVPRELNAIGLSVDSAEEAWASTEDERLDVIIMQLAWFLPTVLTNEEHKAVFSWIGRLHQLHDLRNILCDELLDKESTLELVREYLIKHGLYSADGILQIVKELAHRARYVMQTDFGESGEGVYRKLLVFCRIAF